MLELWKCFTVFCIVQFARNYLPRELDDWETKWSIPLSNCDQSLTCQCLNLNLGHFDSFTFIFVSFRESHLLLSWCAGGRCGIVGSDENRGRSKRPNAEDRGWSHRSGTRWLDDREVGWHRVRSTPCMWRRGARVSCLSLKTKVDGLSVVWPQNRWRRFSLVWPQNRWRWFLPVQPQNQWWLGFLGLGLKTSSYGLVIWASKSPWWFFYLGLKAKWGSVCRLRHKTNGGRSTQDTRRDLAACFVWKHVGLGFPSLPQNWQRRNGRWCTWHHRGGRMRIRLKTNGLMWWATSDPTTLTLLFSMY
jgi:hypothetical protein